MPYATPDEVRTFTGVRPNFLALDNEEELEAWLVEWIGKAQEQINDFTKDSWTDADVPGTVNTATIRFVANAIKAARRHRQEQIQRVDDLAGGAVRPLSAPDAFLTNPIKEDLRPYVKSSKGSGVLRVRRVRPRHERGVA